MTLRTHLGELEAILERHRPALLVLDSFRTLWGGKENDSDAVSGVLDPLRNLVRRYEAGTLLLHHVGRAHGSPYRGSSAFGASCELGFTLARNEDDEDRTRRYVQCWKCRPAPEPPRRWLTLSAEGNRVFVDRADPPEVGEEVEAPTAPVRAELIPRVLGALDGGPLSRADVARSVGRDPKDRSVGRALEALLEGGQVAKAGGDPGRPDMWARKGVATPPEPLGLRHPATP